MRKAEHRMSRESPWLSVVIPAFNESRRIPDSLRTIDAYLASQAGSAELIVVDDGSRDATQAVVRRVAADLRTPVRLLGYPDNRGKGFALKIGFAASRGERILFTDADLSTPIECADALLAALERPADLEGPADLALGSRKMPGARLRTRQPFVRETLGKAFTLLARRIIADVSDVTCGFKAYRGDVGRDLFARSRIPDWSFDAEVLWIAKRRGYRWAEIPVEWADREGTKVRILKDAFRSALGLLQIRLHAAAGRYAQPAPEVAVAVTAWESDPFPEARGEASG